MDFCCIASGSSGNAYYIGMGGGHFLVDAGISGKCLSKVLDNIKVNTIDGIFITHEHSDHISGAGIIARRFKANIYATPLTWRYLLRHGTLGKLQESQMQVIELNKPLKIGDMKVKAFNVPHDSIQPVGYSFTEGENKAVFATDLGMVSDEIQTEMLNCRLLVLESNHDPEMLENGRYPAELKRRVAGERGHLSNAQCGMTLAKVVKNNYTHVVLAHLSEENNTPMLAVDTVRRIIDASNVTPYKLEVADRYFPGEITRYE